MKKTITLFTLLFLNIGIFIAQDFDWAKTIIGDQHNEFQAIEIDDDGNVFTLGNFETDAELSGVMLDAVGGSNIFLAKYNPEGNLLWVKIMDGGIASGQDLKIDNEGNLIIVGHFEYSLNFGNTIINGGAGNDIFIAKLDPTGELIWVEHSTHTPDISAQGISVECDNNGDIIIAGATFNPLNSTTATMNFDGTEITNNGFFDALVLKYSKDGNFLWLDTAGSYAADLAHGVGIDDNNNIYITGIFDQEVIFGGIDTLNSTALAQENAFLIKYRPNGNLVWSKQSNAEILARGQHVGVREGYVYMTGYFIIDMEFGGELIAMPDTNAIYNNYISKIDTLGNIIYTRPYAHAQDIMTTRGLDFDEAENPYVLGRYQGEGMTEDNVVMSNINQLDDFMLTKHDKTTGEILKLWYGGGEEREYPEDVAVKNAGEIYFAGRTPSLELSFQDTTLYFTQGIPGLLYYNGFLIKLLDEDYVNVYAPELLGEIVAYPNPTTDFLTVDLGEERAELFVEVFDITGKKLLETYFYNQQLIELQTDTWTKGMYFVKIKIGNHFATLKILK